MQICSIVSVPIFKANALNDTTFPTQEEFLKTIKSGQKIDFTMINKETGDSLFQKLVNENYTKLLSYMIVNKIDLTNVINKLNREGVTPLDSTRNLEMRILLKSAGALPTSDVLKSQVMQNIGENAKVVAAKSYMTQPVMEKVAEKVTEEKSTKKSFFNAFDEVDSADCEEEASLAKPVVKKEVKEVAQKTFNIEGIEDFKILKSTKDDIVVLDELIGLSDIKEELSANVIKPLKDIKVLEKLKKNNIDIPNGILLQGDDGVVTIIKTLSNETGIPVIVMEKPQELSQIITAIEARYKKHGLRTIILAQGFDKFFNNVHNADVEANTFRNNMQGIKDKGGLFIATALNKSQVNSDFLKSGIIDKVLNISKPKEDDRKEFLKQYFAKKEIFKSLDNNESIAKLAMLTDDLSYNDIKRIIEATARTAISNDREVELSIFEEQLADFSIETDRVPITEANRTSAYDTASFKRIPIEEGEMLSLDELGGMEEIKSKLYTLYIEPMKNLEEMTKIFGVDAIPDGAIFYGAPGNGKTITARILSRELGLPYYETRMSDFATALVHESGKAFKAFADQLDRKFKETGERSVWFLDEFDSLGGSRNSNQYTDKELTNTLLQEFTNPAKRGYILLAATNNLNEVDPALKRRGRLGNWIEFKNPDQKERIDTIKKTLMKHDFTKELANDEKLVESIATELDGFSFSSVVNVLKDAKRDYYLNKGVFQVAIKKALGANLEREIGEFCNKAGLTQHVYQDWSYKSLDELGGMTDVIKQLREYVIDAWDPETRKALIANKRVPSGGFMLEGPSGSGKTTIIETLAREMDVPLYKMHYNQKGNEYIHRVVKVIHEVFDRLALEAKVRKKPVMLFFDEAEKFFPVATHGHHVEEVNTYKELMNLAASKNIILAGATNYIDLVNKEIVGNPLRMGTVIHCGEPDFEDRKSILSKLLVGIPIIDGELTEETFKGIADLTAGFSIGQISDAIDKIIVHAVKRKINLTPEMLLNEFKTNMRTNFLIK